MRGARPFWHRPSLAFGGASARRAHAWCGVVDEAKSPDDPVPPICQAGEQSDEGLPALLRSFGTHPSPPWGMVACHPKPVRRRVAETERFELSIGL